MINKLILLAGNSAGNKNWIEEVGETMAGDFKEVYVQHYDHWETDEGMIDLELEKSKLRKSTEDCSNCVVFGKSAGVILALQALESGIIDPYAMFFVGFPYHFAERIGADPDRLLKNVDIPVRIVQKETDPAINAEDLRQILDKIDNDNIEFERIPGDNHHYGDIDFLRNTILNIRDTIDEQ
jgi:alpha/beta superfamily hydrolase